MSEKKTNLNDFFKKETKKKPAANLQQKATSDQTKGDVDK
jgi:hypothetical protein